MELYQTAPSAAAAEPALPGTADPLALPPFPVLLRVPNFNDKAGETIAPAVKSLAVVKAKPRARRAMKPGTVVQLAAGTLVVVIVSGLAALLHHRPQWFSPRLLRELQVPRSEEVLTSPAKLAEPEPTATSPEATPSLTEIREIDDSEASSPAAQLEADIVPVERGDPP